VTGASGILGRSIVRAFRDGGWEVSGLAFSRSKEGQEDLRRCDLTIEEEARKAIIGVKPDVLIHCMGERRPQEVDADPKRAHLLNVTVTDTLSKLSQEIHCWFLYISTDYVFDGKNPPYSPNAETNPLNEYGKLKREAEMVVWKNQHDAGILRVPILFGSVEYLEESAVTILAKFVMERKPTEIDDWQIRYPTFVDDVAAVCFGLSERKIEHCGLYGTWHFSGAEKYTKYEMAVEIAKIFNLPHDHLISKKSENPKVPQNAQLNCIAIEVMGLAKKTPFAKAIKFALKDWITNPK